MYECAFFGKELFAGYYPKPWFNQNWTAVNYPCAFAEMCALYMYVCICIYAYIHTNIYVNIYTCIYMYIYMLLYRCMVQPELDSG